MSSDLRATLRHVPNVEAVSQVERIFDSSSGRTTYTATCLVYCLLLISRTELRPGPLGVSTVV